MATRKDSQKLQILPVGASEFLRKRAMELVGLFFVALGIVMALSLLSFNPEDPGVNRAVDTPAVNMLGTEGALFSSFMLQTFGLGSLFLVLMPLGWGWRSIRDHSFRGWWSYLLTMPLPVVLGAPAFAALPDWQGWIGPGVTGNPGGTLGLLIVRNLEHTLAIPVWVTSLAALLLACLIFGYSSAVSRSEWASMLRRLSGGLVDLGTGSARGVRGLIRGEISLFPRRDPALSEGLIHTPHFDEEEVNPELRKRTAERKEERRKRKEPLLKARSDARKQTASPENASRESRVENPVEEPKPGKRAKSEEQGRLDLPAVDGEYELPPLHLLSEAPESERDASLSQDALEKNAHLLETVLEDFGVRGEIVSIKPGPVVTRYDLEPAPGTKTSRVVGLADDIARSMSAISVRVAVVPGSNVIGIELPNQSRETVYIHELLASDTFERDKGKLPLVLGKDIGGVPTIADLARMPHLLVAGTTGSGKSVGVNAMILSLLYRFNPDECKFIMIDPKMLELSVYEGIPHLLAPVVTDPKKAVVALKWTVREMEDRYRAMSRLGVRNIDGYNSRMEEARKSGEVLTRTVQTGFDPDTGQPIHEEQPFDMEPLPYIVVIVDEMADLMLVAGKDVEAAIQRLAQMARAAGIHLIMSTQRPSVDVITGTIKANFPTRISFRVTSKIDSRTILGEQGAEQLLGMGDMLFLGSGGRTQRVHGPFASDEEVESVVTWIKRQGSPSYVDGVTDENEVDTSSIPGFDASAGGSGGGNTGKGDELYDKAVEVVIRNQKASTSFVQRQLSIGYNRAATIIDRMEDEGLISAANHVGKREVLVPNREE
ncbi:DNA translocase FtsK [Kiloniella sp. b19]|uniref:DNA translocase FtsK n=1 Tax=Kiloniella sp. GXU_MW_B19 TaxID=3141326 RepID=UPI0031D5967E